MSDVHDDGAAGPSDQPAAEPPLRRYRAMAIGLGAAVIALLIIDGAAPLWAPPLLRSLGWETAAEGPDRALIERIGRLEAAQKQDHPASAPIERLERFEATQKQDRQDAAASAAALQQTVGQAASTMQQLDRRVAALEARPATPAGEITELRQQLAKLSTAVTDLTGRVAAAEKAAVEKTALAQSAADPTDSALLLTLLRIREAVEVARPFAAEYDAFVALAQTRPEIAAAAAPLAEPAKSGVASRTVLIARLHALAGGIATAEAPPAEADWGDKVLARLRGLVTIRRIDGTGQSEPEAAGSSAERTLRGGDLAAAIAALDGLAGPPAEAARPWLQMARQRLAVEAALHRVEELLTARLGAR
jgi:hypothetical protein